MHKDRLLRFGYEIIEQLCQAMQVKITILEESPFRTKEQILCGNLIEILTVYCSAFYGMRSHSNKPNSKCTDLHNYSFNCLIPTKTICCFFQICIIIGQNIKKQELKIWIITNLIIIMNTNQCRLL